MDRFSLIPTVEATEFAADIRQLFDDLSQTLDREHRAYSGECHPALDVLETDDAIEISVDVAGIPAGALRVAFRAGVLLIAGEKAPASNTDEQTFHLVEREFGRFARAVRLNGAFDVGTARATLLDGELTIVLPKIDDRRLGAHHVPVRDASAPRP